MITAMLFAIAFTVPAFAQRAVEPLTNFHEVTETLYRGGRPTSSDQIQFLAQSGFKAVINLQGGDIKNKYIGFAVPWFVKGESVQEISAEGSLVFANGMEYVSLPLSSLRPVTREEAKSIAKALKIMSDPAKQPVFIHCAHGRDRTGLVVALYRMVYQNWSLKDAHDEMISKGHDGIHMALTFSMDQYLYTHAFVSYIRKILP